jgi:hypothetical protein
VSPSARGDQGGAADARTNPDRSQPLFVTQISPFVLIAKPSPIGLLIAKIESNRLIAHDQWFEESNIGAASCKVLPAGHGSIDGARIPLPLRNEPWLDKQLA